MKIRIVTLFLLLTLSLLTKAHTFNMAYYDLTKDRTGYHLKITYDKEDIIAEVQMKYPHMLGLEAAALKQETQDCLIEYVQKNLQFRFDHEQVQLKNWRLFYEESIMNITVDLQTKTKKVKTIEVVNTCLIINDKHNNVIRSHLYDKDRHFRLSRKRQKTIIVY